MNTFRFFVGIFVLICLFSCEQKKVEEEVTEVKPIAVEYITSEKEELQKSFKGNGLTLPFRKTTVMVKAAGDVVAFNLKTGQKVKKGQSVITILSRRQKAQYDMSAVQVEEAKLAYDAVTKLYEKGSVSKAEFLSAKSQHSAAFGQHMANRIAYNDCFVKFPFGGIINWYDETIHKGSIVQPGTPICEVIDLSKVKIKLFFGEKRVVKMSIGDTATAHIPVLNKSFVGTISAIAPAASEKTGAFTVEVTFANDKEMLVKSGMRAEVSIKAKESISGYKVPKRFIRSYKGNKGVYIAQDEKALFVPLEYESNGSEYVIVTSGLTRDDKIITSGFSRLKNGVKLLLTEREPGE